MMNLKKLFKNVCAANNRTKLYKIIKKPYRNIKYKVLGYLGKYLHIYGSITGKTFWGEKMHLIYPEPVSLLIYRDGYYEEGLTNMVINYLKPGMVFCDIGAHFGYFSLLAAKITGDNGQVHSFEPTPSTYEMLLQNVAGKNNIYVNNLAVFSHDGVIILNDYGIGYSSFNTVSQSNLTSSDLKKVKQKQINVDLITLDEYFQKKTIKPDFIKIDAENAEYEILKGMKIILQNVRPIITLEVGDITEDNTGNSRNCVEYLMNYGYKPYEYRSDQGVIEHNIKERYMYDNILFLP